MVFGVLVFLLALARTNAAFSGSFRPSWQDMMQPSSCVADVHANVSRWRLRVQGFMRLAHPPGVSWRVRICHLASCAGQIHVLACKISFNVSVCGTLTGCCCDIISHRRYPIVLSVDGGHAVIHSFAAWCYHVLQDQLHLALH